MEGKQKDKADKPANKDPYFHSVFIDKTKASEKKEYFTNIKEESKFKKNLESNLEKGKEAFSKQKLIKVKSRLTTFDCKKILKNFGLALVAVIVIIFSIETISLLTADADRASSVISKNFQKGNLYYSFLILKASSAEEKANLYRRRADSLYQIDSEKYKAQIEKDIDNAIDLDQGDGEDKG